MNLSAAACHFGIGLVVLLSPQGVVAESPERNLGAEVGKAVADLARMSHHVNFSALERKLELPELSSRIIWKGPRDMESRDYFSAIYEPQKSVLGIEKVVVTWQYYLSPARFLTRLRIVLNATSCLSEESFEEVMGSKGKKYDIPYSRGDDTYRLTVFEFPQPYGKPVQVEYGESDTCRISIVHWRKP